MPFFRRIVHVLPPSAISGIAAALDTPIAAWALGRAELIQVLAAIALLVLWLHRAYIARLRAGTEPKVGQKPA